MMFGLQIRLLAYGLILATGIGVAFWYGEYNRKIGYNQAKVESNVQIAFLKQSLSDSNTKALKAEERRKDAYRIALDVRNSQYETIDNKLRVKTYELRKLQKDTDNKCVNQPIPSNFK